jgi:hypothetical protein
LKKAEGVVELVVTRMQGGLLFLMSAGLLFSSLLLASCAEDAGCTAEVYRSVLVVPVGTDGDPLTGSYNVEYRTEEDTEWTACDPCEICFPQQYTCAWGLPGTFAVRANGEGLTGMTSGIDVGQGRCHVDTQNVEIVMQ